MGNESVYAAVGKLLKKFKMGCYREAVSYTLILSQLLYEKGQPQYLVVGLHVFGVLENRD